MKYNTNENLRQQKSTKNFDVLPFRLPPFIVTLHCEDSAVCSASRRAFGAGRHLRCLLPWSLAVLAAQASIRAMRPARQYSDHADSSHCCQDLHRLHRSRVMSLSSSIGFSATDDLFQEEYLKNNCVFVRRCHIST